MVYHLPDVKKISQKKTSKIRCRPFDHLQASVKFFVEILGRLQRGVIRELDVCAKKKMEKMERDLTPRKKNWKFSRKRGP
jgi:hypothetical protein